MDVRSKLKSATESVKSVSKQTIEKTENAMQTAASNEKVKAATETVRTVTKQAIGKTDEAVQRVVNDEKVKAVTESVKTVSKKAIKATGESIQTATNDAKEKLNKERIAKYALIEKILNEVDETLKDDARTTADVKGLLGEMMNGLLKSEAFGVGAAGAGLAIGSVAGVGLLGALGTAGFSAAGITSGLAVAGGLVGGGMVAGIGVLAAPAVVIGGGAYVATSKIRHKKITQEKEMVMQKVMLAHDKILSQLQQENQDNNERIQHLKLMLEMLIGAKKDIEDDLNETE